MHLSTTVMLRGPANFNQVGQFLGYPLKDLPEQISAGLAQRLAKYAETRLVDAGFAPIIAGSTIEVYTMDGDDKPADRAYVVKFKTQKGGFIEVVGILTRNGWPSLDHGFCIGED